MCQKLHNTLGETRRNLLADRQLMTTSEAEVTFQLFDTQLFDTLCTHANECLRTQLIFQLLKINLSSKHLQFKSLVTN